MNSILLTERDTALLHDCYQNAVLSIAQIRRRHFDKCGKATALNRLSRLKTQGYLKSQRVGIVIYQGVPKKIGVVYQITRTSISYLKNRYPTQIFREEPLQLNTGALPHDLLLTDVLTSLKGRYPGKEVVRGSLVPHLNSGRVPDAIVLDQYGKVETAIELEQIAKSNERYREIILQYRMASEFPSVLYVVGDANIEEKIKCQIIQGKANPLLPAPSTGKFSFVLLHDLVSESKNTDVDPNLNKKGSDV